MCIETTVLHQTHNSCHSDNCERNKRTNDCMSKVHENEVLTSMKGWGGGNWKRRWGSEVRMFLIYSNMKDSCWQTDMCKVFFIIIISCEGKKKKNREIDNSKQDGRAQGVLWYRSQAGGRPDGKVPSRRQRAVPRWPSFLPHASSSWEWKAFVLPRACQ